jgi:hypothetical protein
MSSPLVFFCRCRPQESDAVDIVLATDRVFIGYPAWRAGKYLQDHDFRDAIIDLSATDQNADPTASEFRKWLRQVSANRRLVREVTEGSIVLVPRPARGKVYAGRVLGFELVNNPPWGDDYLTLRRSQGLWADPRASHLADVVQGWRVDRWREVPYTSIPAWIRKSLFGRSTVARISQISINELNLDPYIELDTLIEHPEGICPSKTRDLSEVERRLLTYIGPGTFEHLIVALLQLERPDEIWAHVGGSGDGGVDGVGTNRLGQVVGLLQCKWRYYGERLPFEGAAENASINRYVASLIHPVDLKGGGGATLLDRAKIAKLLLKHSDRLPWATAMQIVS